jgi:hypothetical protein
MSLLPLGLLSQGGGAGGGAAFEQIATTVLTSTANTITFSSIPSNYKHLQLRMVSKTTDASSSGYLIMRFNSDSAANYSYHYLAGNGSSAVSAAAQNSTFAGLIFMNGNDIGSNAFSPNILEILDYADTNKFKTTRLLGGRANAGSGANQVHLESANWRSTSAITSINLLFGDGTNLSIGSRFTLYGMRG